MFIQHIKQTVGKTPEQKQACDHGKWPQVAAVFLLKKDQLICSYCHLYKGP
jgi:hypothetical protein